MRLLVDNALSPGLVVALSGHGHDAIHVRDVGLAHATDTEIFTFAAGQDRAVLSADTDFGTLLALRGERRPSVVSLAEAVATSPRGAGDRLDRRPRVGGVGTARGGHRGR